MNQKVTDEMISDTRGSSLRWILRGYFRQHSISGGKLVVLKPVVILVIYPSNAMAKWLAGCQAGVRDPTFKHCGTLAIRVCGVCVHTCGRSDPSLDMARAALTDVSLKLANNYNRATRSREK